MESNSTIQLVIFVMITGIMLINIPSLFKRFCRSVATVCSCNSNITVNKNPKRKVQKISMTQKSIKNSELLTDISNIAAGKSILLTQKKEKSQISAISDNQDCSFEYETSEDSEIYDDFEEQEEREINPNTLNCLSYNFCGSDSSISDKDNATKSNQFYKPNNEIVVKQPESILKSSPHMPKVKFKPSVIKSTTVPPYKQKSIQRIPFSLRKNYRNSKYNPINRKKIVNVSSKTSNGKKMLQIFDSKGMLLNTLPITDTESEYFRVEPIMY